MPKQKENPIVTWLLEEPIDDEGRRGIPRIVPVIAIVALALLAGTIELYAIAHNESFWIANLELLTEILGG